ncbi:hypothetical protein P7C70_g8028, partial [Phenoliferia sp. Uapishka_3]
MGELLAYCQKNEVQSPFCLNFHSTGKSKSLSLPAFFEPTSDAKALRLLQAIEVTINKTASPLVSFATPNIHELAALYQHTQGEEKEHRVYAPGLWFDSINVNADLLASRLPSWVVEEGIVQMAVQLLPVINTIFVKSGARGVVVVQRITGASSVSAWTSLSRHLKGTVVSPSTALTSEAVVIRHYPALPLASGELGTVTGAGDNLAGAMLAGIDGSSRRDGFGYDEYEASFDGQSRVAGAEFILVVMAFVIMIGIEALVFSRLEHWTFFSGIYFSLVTVLSIGFGDFAPTKTASRILLFPFAVGSIALLAVLVGVFVDFLSRGTEVRKRAWRKKYEETVFAKRVDMHTGYGLAEEIRRMKDLEAREDFLERMVSYLQTQIPIIAELFLVSQFQLASSTIFLAIFWVVGAVIFTTLENFSVGTSLYFCYVFFLTIGYGDLTPRTAGGVSFSVHPKHRSRQADTSHVCQRVFFVVYAIIAVPFVTNFVLNTVSSVMFSITSSRFRAFRLKHLVGYVPHHSHAHNVEESHRRLEQRFGDPSDNNEGLSKVVLGLAIRMEAQATELLINALETGRGHILLRADRNLQRRALGELKTDETYHAYVEEAKVALDGDDEAPKKRKRFDMSKSEAEELEAVVRYRETFAGLLAAGSVLMGLEGEDRLWFERRLESSHVGGEHAGEEGHKFSEEGEHPPV